MTNAKPMLAALTLILTGSSYGVAAAQALAAAPAATPEAGATFDVVRVGDSQLACTALASEINQLTAESAAADAQAQAQALAAARSAQAQAENRATLKRAAFGGLVHASGFIPFGGGFAALAARSAALGAANAAVATPTVVQVQAVTAAPITTPQAQRRTHLEAIFQRNGC